MSDKENISINTEAETVNPDEAIALAMTQIRESGLSKGQIDALFSGEQSITTREALLIAHVQYLEHKAETLSLIVEEIASMGGGRGAMAQTVLEGLATPRKIIKDE